MHELNWQKSSYSEEGANCIYVATTPGKGIRLRESEEPEVVLTTGTGSLRGLIRAVRSGGVEAIGR